MVIATASVELDSVVWSLPEPVHETTIRAVATPRASLALTVSFPVDTPVYVFDSRNGSIDCVVR